MNLGKYFKDCWRLIWPLALAGLAAWQLQTLWPVLAVLALQLVWQVWQKWRLASWLERGELLEPPHAGGLWEDYYTRLMHLFRHEQQAQLQLADIIQRARNVLDSLDEGVVFLSADFRLNYFNRTACQLLDLVSEDSGEVLTNLIRQPQFREYLEAQKFDQALEITAPQRQLLLLSIKVNALGSEGFLLRIENITHIHQLELFKRDFVANVSHELKTPITVFKGAVELLQEAFTESKDLQQDCLKQLQPYQKLIDTMQQQSERMNNLVASLLLLASLEGVKEPRKTLVNINELLDKIRATYDEKAQQKQQQIEWQLAPNLQLQGVASELESAFSNLLENALKYSPEHSLIQVQASQHNQTLIFSVQDNGPGIEPQHLPHLTERFYRIDKSRNRNSGGTGLGLAIVKHVLQRHQGRLTIHSQAQQGSKFICEFMLDKSDASHI